MKDTRGFSRRRLLTRLGGLAASIGLASIASCSRERDQADPEPESAPPAAGASVHPAQTTLEEIVAILFPGPKLQPEHYSRAAGQVISIAESMGAAGLIEAGVKDLQSRDWDRLDVTARAEALSAVEATDFFQFVRFNAASALYGDAEVGQLYGYEGESFSKRGYLRRGFNDLSWLPEPGQGR